MLNRFFYFLPNNVEDLVAKEAEDWRLQNKVQLLWERDARLWTGRNESEWLGWLRIAEREVADLEKYHEFAQFSRNFEFIVLLGMGGSSLCAEVLARTFKKDNFFVLDSTVPAQIVSVEKRIAPEKTLFIVASKSGTTLEVDCLREYFYEKVSALLGEDKAGKHFVAITDPNTKLHVLARERGFSRIFLGEPQIGGRFSALSVFGLIPASAMQIDVERLLKEALFMSEICKLNQTEKNYGAILGLILGVCWKLGKDKLTIFCSKEIESFGAWLEQLIAESTGKEGKAIIPIDKEKPLPKLSDYDDDRLFVHLKFKDSNAIDSEGFAAFGNPFVRIEVKDEFSLSQEFFRWEFATAVASAIMQVNPFDQPDVESTKVETRRLMKEYESSGELAQKRPFFESDGVSLFADESYRANLEKFVGEEKSLAKFLEAHIEHIQEGDYFAILAYLKMDSQIEEALQQIRHKILHKKLCATCIGFGPRFLHSTGQAYKGGPNSGVFLQITANDEHQLPIPNRKYSFAVVKSAQAIGDFLVLSGKKRRILHVHISGDVMEGLERINGALI
ncbi:MAG: hypothetical protein N2Z23_10780 [Pyrinomonadaceae bacterium]|nr:hypothetical protein [Pyrinomonadaceae bacterium]MCX7640910.1 hypothetical protein [Pyrinomonadaceae bacterium]MDW8304692.1 transaldolase [Acidobacteriota bacterium]